VAWNPTVGSGAPVAVTVGAPATGFAPAMLVDELDEAIVNLSEMAKFCPFVELTSRKNQSVPSGMPVSSIFRKPRAVGTALATNMSPSIDILVNSTSKFSIPSFGDVTHDKTPNASLDHTEEDVGERILKYDAV